MTDIDYIKISTEERRLQKRKSFKKNIDLLFGFIKDDTSVIRQFIDRRINGIIIKDNEDKMWKIVSDYITHTIVIYWFQDGKQFQIDSCICRGIDEWNDIFENWR